METREDLKVVRVLSVPMNEGTFLYSSKQMPVHQYHLVAGQTQNEH
jgi:hypothetical protein